MEHIKNQKFQALSNQELSTIISGGKWETYCYSYEVMKWCGEDDYEILAYKTMQVKFDNDGYPKKIRPDK